MFYEIHAERERLGAQNDVAVVRIEQLAPFPFDLVARELYRWGGDVLGGVFLGVEGSFGEWFGGW